MILPRHLRFGASLAFSSCFPFATGLSAQSVFDLSDAASGNFNAGARWTLVSGSGTTPGATASVVIGDAALLGNAEVAMNNSYTLASLIYGTVAAGTDVSRSVVFRGSGDTTRTLTITGDLTKYDSGALLFRHRGQGAGEFAVSVGGDVNLHAGTLSFGGATGTQWLHALSIAGATRISGGTMNLRVRGGVANLGALEMTGGVFSLHENSVVSAEAVRVGGGARLGGSGRVITRSAQGVVVEDGGTLVAGGGGGPLGFDGSGGAGTVLTMEQGARFAFDLSGGTDAVVEFWNYAGASDVAFNNTVIDVTGVAADGVYTLFQFYSDAGETLVDGGIVSGLVLGSGAEQFETAFLSYGDDGITLTVSGMIPEPGSAAALLGAAGLALASGRRRR